MDAAPLGPFGGGKRRPPSPAKPGLIIPRGTLEDLHNRLMPDSLIRWLAHRTGFVRRVRNFDPVVFFWALILDFSPGVARTLSDLHRRYESAAASSICMTSFYERFGAPMAEWLHLCALHLMKECSSWGKAMRMEEKLEYLNVRCAYAVDSTLVPLHEKLEKVWPNARNRNCKAALKLHVRMDILSGLADFHLTPGKDSDSANLEPDAWMTDALLLFDLGYFSLERFRDVKARRGYFVSRLKGNTNPVVRASLLRHRGAAMDIEGLPLKAFLDDLRRKELDCDVAFPTDPTEEFRLCGVRNEATGAYHFYVTNLPPEVFTVQEVSELYRVRWAIENLFKELKSVYQLDAISSCKQFTVEALVYMGLLSLLLTRALRRRIQELNPDEADRIPALRFARVYAAHSRAFLNMMLRSLGYSPDDYDPLRGIFGKDIEDPSPARPRLLDGVTHYDYRTTDRSKFDQE